MITAALNRTYWKQIRKPKSRKSNHKPPTGENREHPATTANRTSIRTPPTDSKQNPFVENRENHNHHHL
jgi:hypothetical protein